jgi:signal peptidase I
MDKDPAESRFVLRRGMKQHDWRTEGAPGPAQTRGPRLALPSIPRPGLAISPIVAASIAIVAVFIVVGGFLALSFHSYQAQGKSMEPELHDGDRLVVGRLFYEEVDFGLLNWLPGYDSSDYRWGSPSRGDVVVFDSPVRDEQLVKRVIGLPGDVVRIREDKVYVNGVAIAEPYAMGMTECLQACGNILVPEGQYFVLGDNRENSVDSRQGWTVPREDISGKVLFSY